MIILLPYSAEKSTRSFHVSLNLLPIPVVFDPYRPEPLNLDWIVLFTQYRHLSENPVYSVLGKYVAGTLKLTFCSLFHFMSFWFVLSWILFVVTGTRSIARAPLMYIAVQWASKHPAENALMTTSVCSIHVKTAAAVEIIIHRANTNVSARLASPDSTATWSCRLRLFSCHHLPLLLH